MLSAGALGDLPPQTVKIEAENCMTDELEALLQSMWIGQRNWLRTEVPDGLESLDVQKIRFDPTLAT